MPHTVMVHDSIEAIAAADWNALLARQPRPTPFMRHEYLAAMAASGSATPSTGWTPRVLACWSTPAGGAPRELRAACLLQLKAHSYGEYVFDHAWAHAYQRHGMAYYPKAVVAPPFTPVPGARLLAVDAAARAELARALVAWCRDEALSSLHVLFADAADITACEAAGLMLRHNLQFHWTNTAPGYADFDAFLAALSQDKRKKIRQERRKVQDAGVAFRWARGRDIATRDWDFFYRCYERTYLEHGNAPYLTRDFFARMQARMPEAWLLFVAERGSRPIATSLIALRDFEGAGEGGQGSERVAYGRYWGALERVDCLHFEACYYQPLAWCIAQGFHRFEGGAQGEHKMARALLPTPTTSAHWLAHPAFASAVEDFLQREGQGVAHYLDELQQRSPFRHAG